MQYRGLTPKQARKLKKKRKVLEELIDLSVTVVDYQRQEALTPQDFIFNSAMFVFENNLFTLLQKTWDSCRQNSPVKQDTS